MEKKLVFEKQTGAAVLVQCAYRQHASKKTLAKKRRDRKIKEEYLRSRREKVEQVMRYDEGRAAAHIEHTLSGEIQKMEADLGRWCNKKQKRMFCVFVS